MVNEKRRHGMIARERETNIKTDDRSKSENEPFSVQNPHHNPTQPANLLTC